MTDHDPSDPGCRCGFAPGTLEALRAATPKAAARMTVEAIEQLPHQAAARLDDVVEQTNRVLEATGERADAQLRAVCEQLNAQLNPILDGMLQRLAALEQRATEPVSLTVNVPELPGVDALASRVAEQLRPSLGARVKDVERNVHGDIVRIIETP